LFARDLFEKPGSTFSDRAPADISTASSRKRRSRRPFFCLRAISSKSRDPLFRIARRRFFLRRLPENAVAAALFFVCARSLRKTWLHFFGSRAGGYFYGVFQKDF
jgi:hypothetical protein